MNNNEEYEKEDLVFKPPKPIEILPPNPPPSITPPRPIDPLPPATAENCPSRCLVFYTECFFKGEEFKVCKSSPSNKRILYRSVFVPSSIEAVVYGKHNYKGN